MLLKRGKKSKLTIGLLIEVEGLVDVEGYKTVLRAGVTQAAKDNNINLLCFAGGALKRSPYNFSEEHRNIIYQFINSNDIDGLIIMSTIGSFTTEKEFYNFISGFKDIPKVFVGDINKDIPSIYIDNKKAMEKLMDHFINDHGYKKIAFIKGIEENIESELRFNIYKDKLKKNNLIFDQDLVAPGNFLMPSGKEAVDLFIDKNKVKFDAIIAANDHMALGAMKELQKRGYNIPEDVAIAGFDDSVKATAAMPPLTTVRQPIFQLGVNAVELLLKKIFNKNIPAATELPSELIIRQSCGCFSNILLKGINDLKLTENNLKEIKCQLVKERDNIRGDFLQLNIKSKVNKDILVDFGLKLFDSFCNNLTSKDEDGAKFIQYLYKKLNEIIDKFEDHSIWQDIVTIFKNRITDKLNNYELLIKADNMTQQARILIGEMSKHIQAYQRLQSELQLEVLNDISQSLFTKNDINQIMDILAEELPRLDINSCFISLYKDEVETDTFVIPEWSRLILACDKKGHLKMEEEGRFFQTEYFIKDILLPVNKSFSMILKPLFFREKQLGFVLFEQGPPEGIIYEMLRTQISNALYSVFLFQKRKESEQKLIEALKELEYTNKKLKSLSLKDELTGLYNRRGFFTNGEQLYNTVTKTNGSLLLFIIEICNLKLINDNYGHAEGDFALVKTTEVLNELFADSDIISRISGNEFTILSVNKDRKLLKTKNKNLQALIKKVNKTYNKSYEIFLKVGVAEYNVENNISFEELLVEADINLYKQKKQNFIDLEISSK